MPRRCSICTHPRRDTIDKAIAFGTTLRGISRTLSVSEDALQRHVDGGHIAVKVMRAMEAKERREALDVVEQLKTINAVSLRILHEARQSGRVTLALSAIDRVHKQIELQAKLLGDLDDRPTVTFTVSPEWVTMRGALMEALTPHPEARIRVAAALVALEAGDAGA